MTTTEVYRFDRTNVNAAPNEPGTYILLQNGVVIYIGRATVSIRVRLQSHLDGRDGACTQAATHFTYELNGRPEARERELLEAYRRRNGRLPRCNDRIG